MRQATKLIYQQSE